MNFKSKIRHAIDWLLKQPRARNFVIRSVCDEKTYFYRIFDNHQMMFDPTEHIGRNILDVGDFDRQMTIDVIEYVKNKRGFPADALWLEVGANIGTQLIYASTTRNFSRYMCIEPDPLCQRLLHLNVQLNCLSDATDVVPVAIGAQNDSLTLKRTPGNGGGAHIRQGNTHLKTEAADLLRGAIEVQVPVRVLPDLLYEKDIDFKTIGLIWMDIEGLEIDALRGMADLLIHAPPLFFEYSELYHSNDDKRELIDIIKKNYSQILIFEKGLREIPIENFGDIVGRADLLLL